MSLGRRRLAQGRCRRCRYVGLRAYEVECRKTQRHPCCWCSSCFTKSCFMKRCFMKPCAIASGERAPGRLWGMSTPVRGVAKRRSALVRIPAPGGRLAVGPVPSAEGNRRPHDAGRHAFRRFTAAFSLDLRTAFWKRTGAADRRNALDSAGFLPRSSAPTSRVAPTDPCSWAGRCLPRPPEILLARPNPQAPPLLRQQAPPVGALCRARMQRISSRGVREASWRKRKICESRR